MWARSLLLLALSGLQLWLRRCSTLCRGGRGPLWLRGCRRARRPESMHTSYISKTASPAGRSLTCAQSITGELSYLHKLQTFPR